MENWEVKEYVVRLLTGGRATPGSGNKFIKGDVRLPGWAFEVKSTINPKKFVLQSSWFRVLSKEKDVDWALVVFIGPHGFVYYGNESQKAMQHDEWKSMTVTPTTMPTTLAAGGYQWTLEDIDSLNDL